MKTVLGNNRCRDVSNVIFYAHAYLHLFPIPNFGGSTIAAFVLGGQRGLLNVFMIEIGIIDSLLGEISEKKLTPILLAYDLWKRLSAKAWRDFCQNHSGEVQKRG